MDKQKAKPYSPMNKYWKGSVSTMSAISKSGPQ